MKNHKSFFYVLIFFVVFNFFTNFISATEYSCSDCGICDSYFRNGTLQKGDILKITADIKTGGNCIKSGGEVDDGIIIDCQGHWINGSGIDPDELFWFKDYSDFIIKNCRFGGGDRGIELKNCYNFTIINSTFYKQSEAIYLDGSRKILIQDTSISNSSIGILIEGGGKNKINATRIYNSTGDGIGIKIKESQDNIILNSKIFKNQEQGVYFNSSVNNLILNSEIFGNKDGIYVYSSRNTTILNNSINNNSERGIQVEKSNLTTIFLNDIFFNYKDGLFVSSCSYVNISYNRIQNNVGGLILNLDNDCSIKYNRICENNGTNLRVECSPYELEGNICNDPTNCSSPCIEYGCSRCVINGICNYSCNGGGSNFPSGLPNWCNVMPLVPSYGGINCHGKNPSHKECIGNLSCSCEGCGGRNCSDCSRENRTCHNGECVPLQQQQQIQVSLHGPLNGAIISCDFPFCNVTFNCSATGPLLKNLSLYGNWSGGWHMNFTNSTEGERIVLTKNLTLQPGIYKWNCEARNETHSAWAQNFTFTITQTQQTSCDAVKIDNIIYSCNRQSDGVCPEDFSDLQGFSPRCSRDRENICYDPDCDVGACVIKTANITPYCHNNNACGANEGDKIHLNSTFNCSLKITKLKFVANSTDAQCQYPMEIGCDSNTNCSGNFSIIAVPPHCLNKTVTSMYVEIFSSQFSAAKNYSPFGYGSFKFADANEAIILRNVSLLGVPTYIQKNTLFNVSAYANFSKGDTSWIKNITFDNETFYNSSDSSVVKKSGKLFGWPEFNASNIGNATISVLYPYGRIISKKDSKNITVFEHSQGCSIYYVEIFDYCETNGCENNEKVELRANISNDCGNVDSLIVSAMNGFCEVSMHAGISCEQYPWQYSCKGNWTVLVPESCRGKRVNALHAVILRGGIPLASKQGNFGSFTFFPAWQGIEMKAIITHPQDESVWHIFSNIWLKESSIGFITNKTWYYSNLTKEWRKYREFYNPQGSVNANTTINFSTVLGSFLGATYINLSVNNATTMDSTYVKIYLWREGFPIAIISNPEDGQIIKDNFGGELLQNGNIRVFFNGSKSFDSNAVPSNNFNLTWFFDINNRTKKQSGYYNTTNITHYIYDKNYSDQFITAELNASDGENSTVDRVTFGFYHCKEGKTKVFAGACLNYGLSERWCNLSDCIGTTCNIADNCIVCGCPTGKYCNYLTNKCDLTQQQLICGEKNKSGCDQTRGCYWNSTSLSGYHCKDCAPVPPGPAKCIDYNNPNACTVDGCMLGIRGQDAVAIRGTRRQVSGVTYEAIATRCSWNGSACNLNVTWIPETGQGGQQEVSCTYTTTIEDCKEGKRKITYTALQNQQNCPSLTIEQRCGLRFEALPFFTEWHAIVAAILIMMFYYFLIKKKK
ncbi:MAG: right-handed parallel beta-helix repeat-containing protein [Candidatus Pacearchaeota archaeon]|nr:right-handed parallel beta-helix repeat-containing protein [Candidatus Pacearchaeota archaeon]